MTSDAPKMTAGRRLPLYVKVLLAVFLGAALGVLAGSRPILFGLGTDDLGKLGILVIKLLKALAIPLIFLSILDSFLKTSFTLRQGVRLIGICIINVSVAMAIGLVLINAFHPGRAWAGKLEALSAYAEGQSANKILEESHKGTLSLLENVGSYVPRSLVEPFSENNVISVVLLSLLAGTALRRLKTQAERGEADTAALDVSSLEHMIEGAYRVLVHMLHLVVELVPLAVFGVVAQVVGKAGLAVFSVLWVFLVSMLVGLFVHALVYYPLVAWFIGKKSPRVYLGLGADAILTGISCNSSLATVPVTLSCLGKMGVSPESSRMAACVGTNLNNDGITLYEAMAALFLAQAVGYDLTAGKQFSVVLQSVMAGAGVAGIPEAGLIVLPLVLGSVGLPEPMIAAALPLIMTVDWIIARVRSGVNVMSDMLVAIVLDGLAGKASTSANPVVVRTQDH